MTLPDLRLPDATFARASRFLLALVLWLLWAGRADATWEATLYTGDVSTSDADVRLTVPVGTDLVFSDVAWESDPFGGAPYYGARVSFWPNTSSVWGVSLEFNHFKVISLREEQVGVRGTRGGVALDSVERLADTFEALDFSNGNNLVLAGLLVRWPVVGDRGPRLVDRLQLFAGASGGYSVPHVNVAVPGSATREYQWAGPAWQALLGTSIRASERVAFVLQYKLSHSQLNLELDSGAKLWVSPLTHHFTVGITLST